MITLNYLRERVAKIDPKKHDAYKKFAKSKRIDPNDVRMVHQNPNERESKRLMKSKDFAKALDMYKKSMKEDVELDEAELYLFDNKRDAEKKAKEIGGRVITGKGKSKGKFAAVKEDVELDEKLKVGSTVTPTKGPHAGHPHEIIHDFGDGNYNIKPKNMSPNRIKYRMGAAKANKKDLKEGNPRGTIATFDGKRGEIKIYKKGSSYTGDTGDMDFSAKNMAELKDKLRRLGANPNRPSTGKLS